MVAEGVTETGEPLVMLRLPGVIAPEPPVKTAVRRDEAPAVMVVGLAVKLDMDDAAVTVTVVVAVTAVPAELVTVRV